MTNMILNTDSYKASHFLQYPPGTRYVSSYIEARGGQFSEAVFFGLQMFIKDFLLKPVTPEDVAEAQDVLSAHGLPFNKVGWDRIINVHGGYLPVEIEALPEGTLVPVRNAMVQIKNTDPECAWLTSYLETALLRAVWYPTSVATVSWHCRKIIERYLEMTSGSCDGIEFKLHDFGARGATCEEAAGVGGLAHLVSFKGTDTLSAILAARRYYGEPMAGFSIPAAEHSTITCWGKDREHDAYANLLAQFAGEGKTVAVVSDSYNLWNAIDNIWGNKLKEAVEQSGGTLVVRPDSGDPVKVVVETIERLMNAFGYRYNQKGYRVLPDCVRVIQGDGVSLDSIESILSAMKKKGQSAENIAFGMGGALLQKVDRDTMKFAMKASAVNMGSEWRDVYKDPITDPGKRSKRGRLAVINTADMGYKTIPVEGLGRNENLLRPVYRNGELLIEYSLSEIRQNLLQGKVQVKEAHSA